MTSTLAAPPVAAPPGGTDFFITVTSAQTPSSVITRADGTAGVSMHMASIRKQLRTVPANLLTSRALVTKANMCLSARYRRRRRRRQVTQEHTALLNQIRRLNAAGEGAARRADWLLDAQTKALHVAVENQAALRYFLVSKQVRSVVGPDETQGENGPERVVFIVHDRPSVDNLNAVCPDTGGILFSILSSGNILGDSLIFGAA